MENCPAQMYLDCTDNFERGWRTFDVCLVSIPRIIL